MLFELIILGFDAYWEVDANETTAINGTWVRARKRVFDKILEECETTIIAEDLGFVTEGLNSSGQISFQV